MPLVALLVALALPCAAPLAPPVRPVAACVVVARPGPARVARPAPEDPPMPSSVPADVPAALVTVAESSGYRRTATHAETVALCDALAEASPLVSRRSMGETSEGRDIPLLVVADPPLADAEAAKRSGKLVVFVFANIHAGEVCGKEAVPRLVRELVLAPDAPEHRALLDALVMVFAPIYNGDGNERFSTTSRPEQDGPAEGQGERRNAQGLDLNRDAMKLEAPESRAMARFLTEWDPHLVMDLHTTNGSFHRYTLTYAPPLNPSGHPGPIAFVRDELLPEVSRRLLARTGYDTFLYGNFARVDGDPKGAWATYSAQPRFGAQNHGLRGHMSILSEAYSHASYEDRVHVTREFVRECLGYAAERASEMRRIVQRGWTDTRYVLGGAPHPHSKPSSDVREHLARVGLRHVLASAPEPAVIKGWVETTDADGRVVPTDEPKDHTVRHDDRFEPTLFVDRPAGYWIRPGHDAVVDTLRAHGITVYTGTMHAGGTHELEVHRVDVLDRAEREFEGHRLVTLETTGRRETVTVDGAWAWVPTAQQLGTLAVYLLEPMSDDGLATWGFFDDALEEGADHPVLRQPAG